MGVQRLVSLLLLVVGLFLLGRDAANLITGAASGPEALGSLWYRTDPGSLNGLQAAVQRYLLPEIWDPGLSTLLRLPAWTVPLGLGGFMLVLDLFSQRRGA